MSITVECIKCGETITDVVERLSDEGVFYGGDNQFHCPKCGNEIKISADCRVEVKRLAGALLIEDDMSGWYPGKGAER